MSITINGTGSITGLTAGGLPDGSITADDIASGAVTAAKLAAGAGGKILQVKHTRYETTTSISTGTSYVNLPFYVAITPSSTTNSIIVSYSVFHEWDTTSFQYNSIGSLNRFVSSTNNYLNSGTSSNRNTGLVMNYITYPSGTGSTPHGFHLVNYVDVPGVTSEVRYYPAVVTTSAATMYINRSANDTDSSPHERGFSWITAMEVSL